MIGIAWMLFFSLFSSLFIQYSDIRSFDFSFIIVLGSLLIGYFVCFFGNLLIHIYFSVRSQEIPAEVVNLLVFMEDFIMYSELPRKVNFALPLLQITIVVGLKGSKRNSNVYV